MSCFCNQYVEVGKAGIVISGESLVEMTPYGGVKVSGKSWVLCSNAGDGLKAWWPLQTQGAGLLNEFIDVTGNGFDGVGGDGFSELCPEFVHEGPFCLGSQWGTTGEQFIQCPADDHPEAQDFAVSMWVKIPSGLPIQQEYQPKPFFSRGSSFTLATTFLNHVQATVNCADGSWSAFSQPIDRDRWYHLAASWKPSGRLQIYLDGSQVASVETASESLLEISGNDSIGRVIAGRGFLGSLLDVRLHPEERTPAWWAAEFQNYCGEFFEVV